MPRQSCKENSVEAPRESKREADVIPHFEIRRKSEWLRVVPNVQNSASNVLPEQARQYVNTSVKLRIGEAVGSNRRGDA